MNDITHLHEWFAVDRELSDAQGNNTGIEVIYWCRNCLATKDSDGGIIE